MKDFSFTKLFNLKFEETEKLITESLKKEGFGVLTRIDMKEKLQEKIGKTIPKYLILGACNPVFAYEALQIEEQIGLFLPCKIIIIDKGSSTQVSIIRPTITMNTINKELLESIAYKIETKLERVLNNF